MTFEQRVIEQIKSIPRGHVTSYGFIAALAGSPRAALQVGRILHNRGGDLPWWRVVNKDGIISIVNIQAPPELQADLLKQEGIIVTRKGSVFQIDLRRFGWQPEK